MQKILAIDDKMDNLATLSALLKNLMPGCAVITAQSGMEGIEKARAELPDAILLDVNMPEMNGFETCRRLMSDERTKHIPAIMITAIKTDQQRRSKGLDIGANAFLAKPIDEDELFSQLQVALRIKKAEDALREERKSLERTVQERTAALRQSEEKYREIIENMQEGYHEVDIKGNFTFFNESMCKIMGYEREELLGMNNRQYADEENTRKVYQVYNRVYQTGESAKNFEWQIIRKDGDRRDIDVSISLIKDTDGHPTGFRGIVRDITDRKRAEEKLKNTLESLRKAVNTTIQVMVSAVETRDPYTAGHQMRSTDLARAIAVEMGIQQEKIDGICMAGSIHDIGKLSIPAEILSKPTELSEIEYLLIKEHSLRGYEILKDVESPWPLAEIVLQHHERLDGSGYPRGLKGEEILMEARILAVADVVESMASHRPYRAGLGIDTSLEEIEKNRGILYDEAVVDTCLRLFREKGFQLAGI